MPAAASAALCISGERECATGWPSSTSRRGELTRRSRCLDAPDYFCQLALELVGGLTISLEIAAEWIRDRVPRSFIGSIAREQISIRRGIQLTHATEMLG